MDQYERFVKPSYDEMISPTKSFADIIIPRGRENHVAIGLLLKHLESKLGDGNLCRLHDNLILLRSTAQTRYLLRKYSQSDRDGPMEIVHRLARLVFEEALGVLFPLHVSLPREMLAVPISSPPDVSLSNVLREIAPTAAQQTHIVPRQDISSHASIDPENTMVLLFQDTVRHPDAVSEILALLAKRHYSMNQVRRCTSERTYQIRKGQDRKCRQLRPLRQASGDGGLGTSLWSRC